MLPAKQHKTFDHVQFVYPSSSQNKPALNKSHQPETNTDKTLPPISKAKSILAAKAPSTNIFYNRLWSKIFISLILPVKPRLARN
jgi:hypothetical protein